MDLGHVFHLLLLLFSLYMQLVSVFCSSSRDIRTCFNLSLRTMRPSSMNISSRMTLLVNTLFSSGGTFAFVAFHLSASGITS